MQNPVSLHVYSLQRNAHVVLELLCVSVYNTFAATIEEGPCSPALKSDRLYLQYLISFVKLLNKHEEKHAVVRLPFLLPMHKLYKTRS